MLVKKGGTSIVQKQQPLLFVQGPPVYTRIPVLDDESTSVFVIQEMEDFEMETPLLEADDLQERQTPIDPSLTVVLAYLSQPFQKQVYRPLQFQLEHDVIRGNMVSFDGDEVVLQVESADGKVNEEKVTVPLRDIREVQWRGQRFEID